MLSTVYKWSCSTVYACYPRYIVTYSPWGIHHYMSWGQMIYTVGFGLIYRAEHSVLSPTAYTRSSSTVYKCYPRYIEMYSPWGIHRGRQYYTPWDTTLYVVGHMAYTVGFGLIYRVEHSVLSPTVYTRPSPTVYKCYPRYIVMYSPWRIYRGWQFYTPCGTALYAVGNNFPFYTHATHGI